MAHLLKDLGCDCDARCGQSRSHEDRRCEIEAECDRQIIPSNPGNNDSSERNEEIPGLEDIKEPEFKPDDKEQDDRPKMRNARDEIRVGDKAKKARTNHKSYQDLAYHRALIDARGKKISSQGDEEKKRHLEFYGGCDFPC